MELKDKSFKLITIVINNNIYHELETNKGSIFNLIKCIDNDNIDYLEKYKLKTKDKIKYNKLVKNVCKHLETYCILNNKQLNHVSNDISHILTLILIILCYEQHTEHYSYEQLKIKLINVCDDNVCVDYIDDINENKNDDFNLDNFVIDDWFRFYEVIKDYSLSDKEYQDIKIRKDISFMTYTNSGYINYTKNLILSLGKCDFPLKLTVYCVDKKSYENLKVFDTNLKLNLKYLNDDDNQNEEFVKLYNKGWNKMMISKLKCIHKELYKSDYVFYTDSDIVFENNYCIKYLIDNLYDNDLLVQNNYNHEFCAGFMFIKSNKVTKDIFNTQEIDMSKFICDQPYLNSKKDSIKYRVLPQELFPVGGFYFKYNEHIKPFIIHFNWAIGNDKLVKMHSYHKWYIGSEQSIMYKDFNQKIKDFNQKIKDDSIILLCCLRDEFILLEYFIKYYENIGITHFIFIDNNSIDGSFEYLEKKTNTNMMLFKNTGSYKSSNLGVIWIEELMLKYCKDKWCLTVDADELLHIQENNLNELRHKMIHNNSTILLTMLLDMYSIEESNYKQGDDFLSHCQYHDVFNNKYYHIKGDLTKINNNSCIRGGIRNRVFGVKCIITKRNFYKYDFYENYYIDVGYHKLINRNNRSNLEDDLNHYPIMNLNLHFKFIKPNLKKQFKSRIECNNILNHDNNLNNNFDGWNKQLKTYSKVFVNYKQFYTDNYSVKYDKNNINKFFWYMYTGIIEEYNLINKIKIYKLNEYPDGLDFKEELYNYDIDIVYIDNDSNINENILKCIDLDYMMKNNIKNNHFIDIQDNTYSKLFIDFDDCMFKTLEEAQLQSLNIIKWCETTLANELGIYDKDEIKERLIISTSDGKKEDNNYISSVHIVFDGFKIRWIDHLKLFFKEGDASLGLQERWLKNIPELKYNYYELKNSVIDPYVYGLNTSSMRMINNSKPTAPDRILKPYSHKDKDKLYKHVPIIDINYCIELKL